MYPNSLAFNHDPLKTSDARCRLAAGAVFIMAVIQVSAFCLLIGVIPVLFLALARDGKTVMRRMVRVNVFCLMLFVTMPLGGESALKAALYTLRVNAAALAYMFFVIPMNMGVIASALLALKVPPKLAALLVLCYRYIFVLYERVFVAILAMRLRRPRQGTLAAWRSYTAVFSSALASAVLRSEKVSAAMRLRGFDGSFPITTTFKWKAQDSLLLAAVMLLSVLLFFLDAGPLWNK
jgi:cobalt/nickel transport system permease protein